MKSGGIDMNVEPVMKLAEVSEYLKVHRSTIYRMLKRRQIPFIKIGSDYRFVKSALDSWIDEQVAASR
jgi:excisionase family DNA binding protein